MPPAAPRSYVTHRGMVEVYTSTSKDSTVWQPRAADPELETEFLRRLMVKLGVPQEQSKAVVAAPALEGRPRAHDHGQQRPGVQMDEGFDRAWRRVGLALDRTGFTVEDRNRNDGLYFVRYVAPGTDKKEPGFFSKLLGGSAATPPLKYRMVVRSQGEATTFPC
jgi:outer membrane protein assembly factor BamC